MTGVLVLVTVVLYVLAALRTLWIARLLGDRREALLLAGAIVLLAGERAGHLLPLLGEGAPSLPFAALEVSAAAALLAAVARLPRALRHLVGSGAPEERVRFLLEGGEDAVVILDTEAARILDANGVLSSQTGRAKEDLVGAAPVEVGPELTPDRLGELLAPLRSGRVPWVRVETSFRRRDGSTYPVGLHIQWGTFGSREVLVVVAVDVTGRKAAEEEARTSRARLEDAQRVAGLATWEWDLSKPVARWSDDLFEMFGVAPGAFVPRPDAILERVHPEDAPMVRAALERAVAEQGGFDLEHRVVLDGGETRWIHVRARTEREANGQGARMVGVCQDITRLREAESAQAAAAIRYRRLFEQAPVSLWEEDVSGLLQRLAELRAGGVEDIGRWLDEHPEALADLVAEVRILDVNPATLDLYGIPTKEPLLGPLRVPLNAANTSGLREVVEALFEGRHHLQVLSREERPGGSDRVLLVSMNLPTRPEDGTVALVSMLDISARLEAEEVLREREAELSSALGAARMGIWHWDMRTGTVVWTREVYEIFGPDAAGFDGSVASYMALLHPDDLPIIQADIAAAAAGDGDYATEVRLRPASDGSIRWMAGQGQVEFGEDGAPVALRGLVWDITAQRAAEQRLRESEARLAWVVDHAPLVVFAMDAEGRFTLSQGKALAGLGLQPGEVVGRSVFDVYAGVPPILEDVRRALAGEVRVTVIPLGDVVFEARYHPTWDARGEVDGVIGIALDITGMVKAQAEQAKLAALVEGSDDFIALVTLDGELAYVNPAGLALAGVPGPDALPERAADLMTLPSGSGAEIADLVRGHGSWRGEVVLRRVDTGAAIPCSANVFMVREPERSAPLAVAAVLRDLREEQEAARERERIARQLRQAQKMETIGTLAGGIAHDFNNLLTPILGYAQMMQGEVASGTPLHQDLDEIMHAASRAKDLVHQILSFSRQREEDFQPVDVAPVLREATRLLRATLPSAIEIRLRVEDGLPWVSGDPTQLHQVILNLATNALHAMKDQNGILGLELAEVEVDEVFTLAHPDLSPGPHVRLTVSDTGKGMSPAVLERVLEPFFTTKEAGEGTGLGLSVVHGIVTTHRGALSLYSEEGAGTTVNVYLPVASPSAASASVTAEEPARQRPVRVLVVDDRSDIASLVRRMLSNLGHEAEAVFGSREAWDRIRAQPDYFDLLVTDYSMPEMSGIELLRRVREVRPDLPVVLASGFSDTLTPERLDEEGVNAFLTKPFVAKELARAIERALGG